MSIANLARYGAYAALVVVPLVGCERRETRTEQPVTEPPAPAIPQPQEPGAVGGGPTSPINMSLDQIAQARCAREMKCGNIAADKKFTTNEACLSETKRDFADDLNAEECPAGIDQKELDECLQEIKNEDCGNPFDTLGRLAACRTSDLCRNVK